MIRKEIAQAAIDLAQELDARNLGIVAQPGSVIAKLTGLSTISFNVPTHVNYADQAEITSYTPTADNISDESSFSLAIKDGDNYGNQHATTLEEAITSLAPDVARHLNHARNIVNPAVKEFHDRVKTSLDNVPKSSVFNPTIKQVDVPAPLLASAMLEAVGEFAKIDYQVVSLNVNAGEKTIEDLTALILTGNAVVDGDIHQWLAEGGSIALQDVWRDVFQNSAYLNSLTDKNIDAAMAAFLLARKIAEEPIAGVTISLTDWKTQVFNIRNQAGLRLANAITERESIIKNGFLFKTYSDSIVVVNKPVYQAYLENGGSDAVVFGGVLLDRLPLTTGELNEKAAQCLEVWERQNRMIAATQLNNRFVNLKRLMNQHVLELLQEKSVQYFEILNDVGPIVDSCAHPAVAAIIRDVTDYIDALQPFEMECLWKLSLNVIAKHVFGFTSAYEILEGIDRFCKENQDIDPMEASLLATIEYVTDYVVQDLTVVNL